MLILGLCVLYCRRCQPCTRSLFLRSLSRSSSRTPSTARRESSFIPRADRASQTRVWVGVWVWVGGGCQAGCVGVGVWGVGCVCGCEGVYGGGGGWGGGGGGCVCVGVGVGVVKPLLFNVQTQTQVWTSDSRVRVITVIFWCLNLPEYSPKCTGEGACCKVLAVFTTLRVFFGAAQHSCHHCQRGLVSQGSADPEPAVREGAAVGLHRDEAEPDPAPLPRRRLAPPLR